MSIHPASAMKCLFMSFAHGLFSLLGLLVPYFQDVNLSLILAVADIFSQFVSCLFTVFLVFSDTWAFMQLKQSLLFLYSLFSVWLINHSLSWGHKNIFLFSFAQKIVKIFLPLSSIYLELILVNGVRGRFIFFFFFSCSSSLSFFYIANPLSSTIIEELLLFHLFVISLLPCICRSLYSVLQTLCLSLHQFHCIIFCDFTIVLAW